MKTQTAESVYNVVPSGSSEWLRTCYFVRAAVSFLWVGAALIVAASLPIASAVLLIVYPAWDAAANMMDAHRNGGFKRNPTQALNALMSMVATIAIAVALLNSMNAVLAVYGGWAVVSGLLQLAVAVRRWKVNGAQWVMILSGAQSALAGGFFIKQSTLPSMHSVTEIAPYAAFGAVCFLISAIWLLMSQARRLKVWAISGTTCD